jgi:hypothetical protein
MWRLNIRLHKVAPVDPALQRPIEIDAKMEKPEEVENVPMPGGIVVTKHQATLIKEVVRLVLLWRGGTTILVVLEGVGGGRWEALVPTDWPGLCLSPSLVFVQAHSSLPRIALGSTLSAPPRPLPFPTEAGILVM